MVETQLCKLRGTSDTFLYDTEYGFCGLKAPSYRVAKNLFSEIKNQDQKPINAKICFFSPIEHVVGTRAIFQNQQLFTKSTAADKKSWKGTWEVTSRMYVLPSIERMLCCTFAQARRCNVCSSCHKGPAANTSYPSAVLLLRPLSAVA